MLGMLLVTGTGMLVTMALDSRPVPPPRMRLSVPVIPDDQNGWPLLRRACDAVQRAPEDAPLPKAELSTAHDPRVLAHLERNAEALRLTDAALARPQFHFGRDHYVDDVTDLNTSAWADRARGISVLYERRSLAALASGDWAAAERDATQAILLGRRLEAVGGSSLTHYRGFVVEYAGLRAAGRLTGVAPDQLSPAERDGLHRLLSQWLDEHDVQPNVSAALTAEAWLTRVWVLPIVRERILESNPLGSVTALLSLDPSQTARSVDDALAQAEQDSRRPIWLAAYGYDAGGTPSNGWALHNWAGRPWADYVARTARQTVILSYQIRSGRRLAATCIALRLYQDRHGRLPETLDGLVADGLLPAVPIDPFGGQPLRYLAGQGLLYSIGANVRDDGGVMDQRPAESQDRSPLVHDDNRMRLPWVPTPTQP